MALDTAAKRLAAMATRRLPWIRGRFSTPRPADDVSTADRQQVGFMYNGFIPEDPFLPVIELNATIDRTAEIDATLLR